MIFKVFSKPNHPIIVFYNSINKRKERTLMLRKFHLGVCSGLKNSTFYPKRRHLHLFLFSVTVRHDSRVLMAFVICGVTGRWKSITMLSCLALKSISTTPVTDITSNSKYQVNCNLIFTMKILSIFTLLPFRRCIFFKLLNCRSIKFILFYTYFWMKSGYLTERDVVQPSKRSDLLSLMF